MGSAFPPLFPWIPQSPGCQNLLLSPLGGEHPKGLVHLPWVSQLVSGRVLLWEQIWDSGPKAFSTTSRLVWNLGRLTARSEGHGASVSREKSRCPAQLWANQGPHLCLGSHGLPATATHSKSVCAKSWVSPYLVVALQRQGNISCLRWGMTIQTSEPTRTLLPQP